MPAPVISGAATGRYQIGYTFDKTDDPGEDISGIKNLPAGNSFSITDGFGGTKGNSSKITVDSSVLTGQNYFTAAFNVKLKKTDSLFSNLFYVSGESNSQYFYIESFYYNNQFFLTAYYKLGSTFFSLPLTVPQQINDSLWIHCAVVFGEDAQGKFCRGY